MLAAQSSLLLVDDDPNTLASLSRAFVWRHEATVCDNANVRWTLAHGNPT